MNINTSIKSRKSPESFLPTPLKREDVRTIVESGIYAPIFGEIHFTVVENEKVIESINHTAVEMLKNCGNEYIENMAKTPNYNAVRNAQTIIVLSALNGNDPQGFNMANVSCAAQNMLLTATELNIGSRFAMGPVMALTQEPVKSMITLPEGFEPLVVVLLGNVNFSFEEREKEITNISYI